MVPEMLNFPSYWGTHFIPPMLNLRYHHPPVSGTIQVLNSTCLYTCNSDLLYRKRPPISAYSGTQSNLSSSYPWWTFAIMTPPQSGPFSYSVHEAAPSYFKIWTFTITTHPPSESFGYSVRSAHPKPSLSESRSGIFQVLSKVCAAPVMRHPPPSVFRTTNPPSPDLHQGHP